jgi:hypothetical protein
VPGRKQRGAREITLRERPRGGNPLRESLGTDAAHSGHLRMILLVHGYNVSVPEAAESFDTFEQWFAAFAPHLAPACLRVFWPGDAFIPFVRTLRYPSRLGNAKKSSPALAWFLVRAAQKGTTDIVLIGHSLGCRLILETLRRVHRLKRRRQEIPDFKLRFILMAPAVPVRLVSDGGRLQPATQTAELRGVLYSRHDEVLGRIFEVGQSFGKDGLPRPIAAVGRTGLPGTSVWSKSHELLFHRHGHYWSSRDAARIIAGWLGAAQSASPPARAAGFEREVAPPRDTGDDRIAAPPRAIAFS